MNKLIYQLMLGAALIIGVAIGYCFAPTDLPVTKTHKPSTPSPIQPSNHSTIQPFNPSTVQLSTPSVVTVTNVVTITNSVEQRRPSPREWMENLKKSDPKRFAQMTNRFAQARRRHQERAAAKAEYLASVPTSSMTDAQRKNHERLQELIADREELMDSMHDENLTDEERRELGQKLHAADREMREVNRIEREALIEETARELGIDDDTATDFTATMKDIIDLTNDNGRGPHGPPPDGDAGGPSAGQPPPR